MVYRRLIAVGLLVSAMSLSGCGQDQTSSSTNPETSVEQPNSGGESAEANDKSESTPDSQQKDKTESKPSTKRKRTPR